MEWAKDNSPLLPISTEIPERGFDAIGAFASAAINTARNWQDNSYVDHPGFRDRIVRVLQTKSEGGMNLYMGDDTIDGLAVRGRTAATAIIEQFTERRYPCENPTATGWDNHRWVRYRALLSLMPDWLASYERGRAVLEIEPTDPPSYKLSVPGRQLANRLSVGLDGLAKTVAMTPREAVGNLTRAPRPQGAIRRIPRS